MPETTKDAAVELLRSARKYEVETLQSVCSGINELRLQIEISEDRIAKSERTIASIDAALSELGATPHA